MFTKKHELSTGISPPPLRLPANARTPQKEKTLGLDKTENKVIQHLS
jgi:hypothetical protein